MFHRIPFAQKSSSARPGFSCWILLLLLMMVLATTTHGFAPVSISCHHRQQQETKSSVLFAKKSQGSKKKKAKTSGGGGFGGGFGSTSSATASSSSTSNKNLEGKVRTVSGFSGSGTKPLRQAANTFDAIREQHGKDSCSDLYCRSPLDDPDRLWFVGKVACVPGTAATPTLAVLSQKRLILEYAKRELRPQNLARPEFAGTLELWLAPGDSEMDCVQNKVSLEKVEGSNSDLEAAEGFSVSTVGYNPEIYVGDEKEQGGLRITRDAEGNPIKPVFEINQ